MKQTLRKAFLWSAGFCLAMLASIASAQEADFKLRVDLIDGSRIIGTTAATSLKLDVGLELRFAEREIETGASGRMRRLQAVAKYSF